jgi:hypothetical protein
MRMPRGADNFGHAFGEWVVLQIPGAVDGDPDVGARKAVKRCNIFYLK